MQTIGAARKLVNQAKAPDRGIWDRPGFLVRRLHQIHVALFLEEVAGGEVTPIQYGLLTILSMHPGIDQFTLGEELGLDRANVAGILKRLEARGWVKRMVDIDNRRRKLCVVTPAGKAFLKAHDHEMQASQQRLLSPLGVADRHQFLALLERLVEGNNDAGRAALRPGGKAFGESAPPALASPSASPPNPKPRRGASR
jgi:DNA-binding MarR family transcriptional regulator